MSHDDPMSKIKEGLRRVVSPPTDEVVDALYELGFDRRNIGVLYLVPMIFVAWADGTIQSSEADAIVRLASERGLNEKSLEMLRNLLEFRPEERYLRRCLRVLVRMYNALPIQEGTRAKRDLIDLSWEVARASGGFLGLGNKVSDEEKGVLEQIASGLRVSRSERAAALHEKLITRQFQAIEKISYDE